MKLEISEGNFLVTIKDDNIQQVNFDDMTCVEKYFKKILLQLKELYNIDIKGFYYIYAYIDLNERYNYVLELLNENSI